jgi:PAS domain S-box-containing protein
MDGPVREAEPAAHLLTGGGAMGALLRAHDWTASPLGAPESWPQPLKTLVGVMLSSNQPMFVAWGLGRTVLYNDAYAEILAAKHPSALGRDFLDVWSEIRADLVPIVEQAYAGEPVHMDDLELVMDRRGYREETHFAFSYTPVRDETGAVAGFFCPCVEITEQVFAQRRRVEDAERQRRLFEQAPGFITILKSPEHVFEFANAAYRRVFGDRGYVGKTVREAFPDLINQEFFSLLDAVYATGERFVAQGTPIRLEGQDGAVEERYLDFIYEPVIDESGRTTGIFVEGHDVTAAYLAQSALRESEARLAFLDRLGAETATLGDADAVLATTTRLLGEHLGLSVCAYADMDEDEDGFTIRGDWAAPGSTTIVGHYSLAAFGKLAVKNLGAGLPLVVADNLRELAPEEAATFQNIGIAATICMPLVKEGRLTALMAIHDRVPRDWTEAELTLLREVTGRSWAHVERVAAIADLRDSEARYRTLFESIESGFCVVELDLGGPGKPIDYRIVEANPAFYRHTGFPGDITNQWLRSAAPELEEYWYETYGRVARTGVAERFEQGSNHLGRWFDVFAFRTGAAEEQRVGILFNDISARRMAEEQLRELNETLEQRVIERTSERNRVWEMSRDLFAIMGFDGKLKAINPAWETIFGRDTETLLALSFKEQVHPDDHAAVEAMMERLLRGETVDRFEDRIRHADGSWRWISWTLVPESGIFFAVGRDVTADKRAAADLEEAQEALRQSQKMEAMGQLTGGVAHDFNNLLTPIIGSLDMLQRRAQATERERRLIDGALQSAEKAKTLVQRLLAFARRQPLQAQPVDVRKLVDGMAELVASTSGPHVKVVVDATESLPFAQADPNQLEMAILNLSVNARDAMPDGGTLTITAKLDSVGDGHRSKLPPGRYVRLSVADTGVGMDEGTLARAVEPFFSTKGIGRGTGLGLSMVDGLAAQLGGSLAIESKPSLGTCIDLWLPATDAPANQADTTPSVPRSASAGTALLVDDEELVRSSKQLRAKRRYGSSTRGWSSTSSSPTI